MNEDEKSIYDLFDKQCVKFDVHDPDQQANIQKMNIKREFAQQQQEEEQVDNFNAQIIDDEHNVPKCKNIPEVIKYVKDLITEIVETGDPKLFPNWTKYRFVSKKNDKKELSKPQNQHQFIVGVVSRLFKYNVNLADKVGDYIELGDEKKYTYLNLASHIHKSLKHTSTGLRNIMRKYNVYPKANSKSKNQKKSIVHKNSGNNYINHSDEGIGRLNNQSTTRFKGIIEKPHKTQSFLQNFERRIRGQRIKKYFIVAIDEHGLPSYDYKGFSEDQVMSMVKNLNK